MAKSWLKKSAGIIFTDGKSILLLKRDNEETWDLPGGKSNDGETEIDNAIRETKEETGLEKIPGERFDSISHKDANKKYTTFFYKVDKQFPVKLSHEHSDYEWVPFNELKNRQLYPKLKINLPDYLKKIRKKVADFAEWTTLKDLETFFG
jgi:dATP pyrophosphohydrolase